MQEALTNAFRQALGSDLGIEVQYRSPFAMTVVNLAVPPRAEVSRPDSDVARFSASDAAEPTNI